MTPSHHHDEKPMTDQEDSPSVIQSNGRAAKLRTEGSGFTLDTSGMVLMVLPNNYSEAIHWVSLDPFKQGYLEAAARSLYLTLLGRGWEPEDAVKAVAFRKWAPETLARIIADCAVVGPTFAHLPALRQIEGGRDFWANRQSGSLRRYHLKPFPPLTVTLGDDGKVRFGEAPTPLGEELGATGGRRVWSSRC